MAQDRPKVDTEYPNREAAKEKPRQGEDRPGFDLGGSEEEQPSGPTTGNTIPGGPKNGPVPGQPKDGARR